MKEKRGKVALSVGKSLIRGLRVPRDCLLPVLRNFTTGLIVPEFFTIRIRMVSRVLKKVCRGSSSHVPAKVALFVSVSEELGEQLGTLS